MQDLSFSLDSKENRGFLLVRRGIYVGESTIPWQELNVLKKTVYRQQSTFQELDDAVTSPGARIKESLKKKMPRDPWTPEMLGFPVGMRILCFDIYRSSRDQNPWSGWKGLTWGNQIVAWLCLTDPVWALVEVWINKTKPCRSFTSSWSKSKTSSRSCKLQALAGVLEQRDSKSSKVLKLRDFPFWTISDCWGFPILLMLDRSILTLAFVVGNSMKKFTCLPVGERVTGRSSARESSTKQTVWTSSLALESKWTGGWLLQSACFKKAAERGQQQLSDAFWVFKILVSYCS